MEREGRIRVIPHSVTHKDIIYLVCNHAYEEKRELVIGTQGLSGLLGSLVQITNHMFIYSLNNRGKRDKTF